MTLETNVVPVLAHSAPYAGRLESAVSWPAIFAGAATALAVSLILTTLAAGFGLTLGYPGLASPASLTAFTPEFGAVAMAIQVIAAALGGFVTGRLRPNWLHTHGDEAHFRDTANGLITWAVSTVVGVVLAVMVLAPYAQQFAPAGLTTAPITVDAVRAQSIAAQSSLFIGVGMLLSAFVSAVAARLGGHETEAMYLKGRV